MSSFTSRAEERHYFETQVSEKEFLEWYKTALSNTRYALLQ